jgi:hypothetical protein
MRQNMKLIFSKYFVYIRNLVLSSRDCNFGLVQIQKKIVLLDFQKTAKTFGCRCISMPSWWIEGISVCVPTNGIVLFPILMLGQSLRCTYTGTNSIPCAFFLKKSNLTVPCTCTNSTLARVGANQVVDPIQKFPFCIPHFPKSN